MINQQPRANAPGCKFLSCQIGIYLTYLIQRIRSTLLMLKLCVIASPVRGVAISYNKLYFEIPTPV